MPDAPPLDSPTRVLLAENGAAWLGATMRRRSRRTFDGTPVGVGQLGRIEALCEAWRPYPDARVVLVTHPLVDIFRGVLGSYGKVVGSPHVMAFVGDEQADYVDQHVGYTGEAIVLEAAGLGLATCWIGGFFSERKAGALLDLAPGERVYGVSPLGHAVARESLTERTMAGMAGAHHRKQVADIAQDAARGQWPAWAVAAVETARVAPSAMNRQPWRFRFEDDGLVVARDGALDTPKITKRLDIGIAMLHVEIAAEAHGVRGQWTDLAGGDVARFDPKAAS